MVHNTNLSVLLCYITTHVFPPVNVTFKILTPTSAQVSWNPPNSPEIQIWIVYYQPTVTATTVGGVNGTIIGEMSLNISGTSNSAVIGNLVEGVEYVFEVVAVAVVNGNILVGPRVTAIMVTGKSL